MGQGEGARRNQSGGSSAIGTGGAQAPRRWHPPRFVFRSRRLISWFISFSAILQGSQEQLQATDKKSGTWRRCWRTHTKRNSALGRSHEHGDPPEAVARQQSPAGGGRPWPPAYSPPCLQVGLPSLPVALQRCPTECAVRWPGAPSARSSCRRRRRPSRRRVQGARCLQIAARCRACLQGSPRADLGRSEAYTPRHANSGCTARCVADVAWHQAAAQGARRPG